MLLFKRLMLPLLLVVFAAPQSRGTTMVQQKSGTSEIEAMNKAIDTLRSGGNVEEPLPTAPGQMEAMLPGGKAAAHFTAERLQEHAISNLKPTQDWRKMKSIQESYFSTVFRERTSVMKSYPELSPDFAALVPYAAIGENFRERLERNTYHILENDDLSTALADDGRFQDQVFMEKR